MANVTDDIDALGKLISQLLGIVDTVAPKKTTEEVPRPEETNHQDHHHQQQHQNGQYNLQQSQSPPISRIEALCEEVKQILRKHYVFTAGACEEERPAITSTEPRAQWQQSTFLLSLLEGQISRSNHSNCPLDDVRLFRYHLLVALSYAVVGIANLLLSWETTSTPSPVTEPPSSTILSGPSSQFADLESCNQPANVLSTKYEAVIRMATHYLLQTAFIGSLKHYFANAEQLFLSPVCIVNQKYLDSAPVDKVEIFLLKPIYLLYVNLILREGNQTLVSKYIRDSLFVPLMGCFVVYRLHNTKKSSVNCYDEQFRLVDSSMTTKFNQFVAEPSNQMYAIRGLLVCIKAAPDKVTRTLVAISLSKFISQPKGIEIILDAILDSDVNSEEETTIATRQEFIAKMITSIPLKADDVAVIHRVALKQSVCDLLLKEKVSQNSKHSVEIYRRMGALIVRNIASVDSDFIKKSLFDELTHVFAGDQSDLIADIESAVLIVHQLLLHRVSIDLLQQMIAPLFYIRLVFEKKISPIKAVLDETLIEALNEIPESYYLLDTIVYGKMDTCIDLFEAKIDISGPELVYHIRVRPEGEKKLSTEETLECIQSLTTLTLSLLKAMTPNYRYNYLFILLDRLTEPAGTHSPLQSLVLLELLEQLNKGLLGATISKAQEDSREGLLFADPRTMRFLAITFQKVVEQLVSRRPPEVMEAALQGEDEEEGEDAELASHWARSLQSLTFCIGALELFVMKHSSSSSTTTTSTPSPELSEEEEQRQVEVTEQLQSCCTTLSALLRCAHFNQLLDSREQTELLYQKLEGLVQPRHEEQVGDTGDEELTRTLQELRHPMLPVQTHAIIHLRQMLQRRHCPEAFRSHLPTVLEELKRCLENGDSYLYLAAIQTLGQLGVRFTAEVMPLLLQQYVNLELHSLEERLKTGEVLRRIAHSIGDFAYNYAPTFIGHMRLAIRSPEPAMKISGLAVLGEYCAVMRHGLHRHLVELNGMLDELATDSASTIEVKRAAVHFLRLLLQGRRRLVEEGREEGEDANEVAEQLKPLKAMVVTLQKYSLVLDDVLQMHVQLAREELARLFEEFVAPLTADDGGGKRCLREKDLIKFL